MCLGEIASLLETWEEGGARLGRLADGSVVSLAFVPDARFLQAAKQFSAPRFAVLEKVWRLHGDDVIWNTYSKGIEDQFEIGRAAVEFTVIQRQYLHLAHLVGVA